MTNIKLIDAATNMAIIYCEEKGVMQDTDSIRHRVQEWYNNTDITEAEMLAAVALEFTSFECLPFSILIEITEMYFPRYAVWEENDTRWDF